MRRQALLGFSTRATLDRLAQLALDRRGQARQVVLDENVVRARLEHLDRGFLADGPGDHQEGNVRAVLLEDLDGGEGVEAGKGIVADDEIPRFVFERGAEVIGLVHAARVDGVAGLFEVADDEQDIILGIIEN